MLVFKRKIQQQMIAVLVMLLIILLFLVIGYVLWLKKKNEKKQNTPVFSVAEVFDNHNFIPKEIYQANKNLFLSLNKLENRFAIVKNVNPKNASNIVFIEFPITHLLKIKQTKISAEIIYLYNSKVQTLKITPLKEDVKKLLYYVYKKTNFKAIEIKHPDIRFDIVSSSDWDSTYVWAFSSRKSVFVYYDSEKRFVSHEINLLKTNLTLDIKYSYFEMSIYNINQQLLSYETEFYDELFNSLFSTIKEKFACIKEDALYYDNNNNVVFWTNGVNSLQIVNLETVEEVYYYENKLSFKILQNDKTINYIVSKELSDCFSDFVINYNLKQIASNFNYATDKLINTSENTKLLIDYTRNRVVYCAALNTFSKFSYYTIAFDSIIDAEYFKNGKNIFVRIYLEKDEKIDISCKKSEVAHYILAQLKVILNEKSN